MSKSTKVILIVGMLLLIAAGYFGYKAYKKAANQKLRDKILKGASASQDQATAETAGSNTGYSKSIAEIKVLADPKGIARLKSLSDKLAG